MKKLLLMVMAFAITLATLVGDGATPGAQAAETPDTYFSTWDSVTSQAIAASTFANPEIFVTYAYVDIAIYDSVIAVKGGYEPFMIEVHAPHASAEAAVAAAAHRILVKYLPGQEAAIIGPAYTSSLAGIPDGEAKTAGIQLGEYVANTLITMRANDGFLASIPYRTPNPPVAGVWIPTAPTPALGTWAPLMKPFSLASASQFRPGGPPDLSSRRWASDFTETSTVGDRSSVTRTADQTLAARFWAESGPIQEHGAIRRFALEHNLDLQQVSRLAAMISVTQADAMIACFDAKYRYSAWRPVTAVPAGNTDGNDETNGIPGWLPLLPATPNHPEYPSFHSCHAGIRSDNWPLPRHR